MYNKVIPYGKQSITDDDIDAVVSVLKGDFLTQGPTIEEFEIKFAQYVGSKYAISVSNGTTALHLSAMVMKLKPGQKVITTPITFAATANCVKYCGAEVVFVDIDPETYLIDINQVLDLLKKSPKGTYSGIIPVDFSGHAVNLEKLKVIAEEYNLWIIEDACHAPGGYFVDSKGQKQYCGNGNFADVSVFSFHPVKHIACGEGGMITTNNFELYEKIKLLRTHGITKDSERFTNDIKEIGGIDSYPTWYMEMQSLGFNYRITDFQAALGLSQLLRAEKGLLRRREIANLYSETLKSIKSIKGQSGIVEGHAYHLYIIEVDNRLEVFNYLKSQNIMSQIHYIPLHMMPYYKNLGWKIGDFPNAENYYSKCLSIPMYPSLEDNDVSYVLTTLINRL